MCDCIRKEENPSVFLSLLPDALPQSLCLKPNGYDSSNSVFNPLYSNKIRKSSLSCQHTKINSFSLRKTPWSQNQKLHPIDPSSTAQKTVESFPAWKGRQGSSGPTFLAKWYENHEGVVQIVQRGSVSPHLPYNSPYVCSYTPWRALHFTHTR